MYQDILKRRGKRKAVEQAESTEILEHQSELLRTMGKEPPPFEPVARVVRTGPSRPRLDLQSPSTNSMSSLSHVAGTSTSVTSVSVPRKKKAKKPVTLDPKQMTLDGGSVAGGDVFSAALADWIHSCGMPFSTANDPKFQHMIKCAKGIRINDYTWPSRKDIGGKLLRENYATLQKRNMELLKKDFRIFGGSLYCDGATVRKNAPPERAGIWGSHHQRLSRHCGLHERTQRGGYQNW